MSEFTEDKSRAALPSAGSVLSYVPDSGWAIEFTGPEEKWSQAIHGWAVVVCAVDYDGESVFSDPANYETELQPVILVDGKYLMPVNQAIDRDDVDWAISRA